MALKGIHWNSATMWLQLLVGAQTRCLLSARFNQLSKVASEIPKSREMVSNRKVLTFSTSVLTSQVLRR
jgi:hypothetical protein